MMEWGRKKKQWGPRHMSLFSCVEAVCCMSWLRTARRSHVIYLRTGWIWQAYRPSRERFFFFFINRWKYESRVQENREITLFLVKWGSLKQPGISMEGEETKRTFLIWIKLIVIQVKFEAGGQFLIRRRLWDFPSNWLCSFRNQLNFVSQKKIQEHP